MIDDYYDAESAIISHTGSCRGVWGGGEKAMKKTLRTKLSDDRGKKTLQP